ncbi:MerR family transcriptional regulator [Actinomyces sp.]|uniref:MerR family transcriptional regulator n=1 Tax=Actinomyces sp. TaxID=29317 RepID=UPI0026DB5019|nr:MerR family transcriptional regulator [Actinomyces sp.]MDO4899210.1 MerR family transcriptional regulator [Actinomyces sp.]
MSAPATAAAERTYTIGEAARETGLTTSALRFYDREGLIPGVARTGGGTRRFTEDDLEWVRYVERLKMSGMPIKEIREYVRLYFEGDSTIEARRRMVQARRREVLRQLEELQTTLDFIDYKCWFYEVAAAAGSCDAPRTMPLEQLPPRIRRIKESCGIHRY